MDGLLEAFEALLQSFWRSLVPEIATLQVKLVSFSIPSRVLGQSSFLIARELQSQRRCHVLRQLPLQRLKVANFTVVAFPPEVTSISRVDELSPYRQFAALCFKPSD
jgi:hypothetical protein